jgi:hypothetical protein
MRKLTMTMLGAALAMSLVAAPATAQRFNTDSAAPKAPKAESVTFSSEERHIITEYYRALGGGGKGEQPAEHKGRFDSTAKPKASEQQAAAASAKPNLRALPPDLEAKLPKVHPGFQRVVMGDSVGLMDITNGGVADVLRGVVPAGR